MYYNYKGQKKPSLVSGLSVPFVQEENGKNVQKRGKMSLTEWKDFRYNVLYSIERDSMNPDDRSFHSRVKLLW